MADMMLHHRTMMLRHGAAYPDIAMRWNGTMAARDGVVEARAVIWASIGDARCWWRGT